LAADFVEVEALVVASAAAAGLEGVSGAVGSEVKRAADSGAVGLEEDSEGEASAAGVLTVEEAGSAVDSNVAGSAAGELPAADSTAEEWAASVGQELATSGSALAD